MIKISDPISSDRGFVGLWLIVAVFSMLVTLILMPKNLADMQVFWKDRDAQRCYKQVQEALNTVGDEARKIPVLFIFNQVGPGTLPYPFDRIVLPEGVVVDYAVRFWFLGYGDLRMLQVHHQQSQRAYRQFSINGKFVEQIVQSNLD